MALEPQAAGGGDVPELPTATLFCCPAALALPTADPHALAVECMLRFAGAHYVRRSAPLPVALEISGGPAVVRRRGAASCLRLIDGVVALDAEVLPGRQRPLAHCVEVLVEKSLFPAFVYITHEDAGLFDNSLRKGVVPKVATVWQRLRGTYRRDVLRHATCCGRYSGVEEALAEAEKGLRALEAVCAANASAAGAFLLGTGRPCSADAFAYAAASSYIHADFAGHGASSAVVAAQRRMRAECPALVEYVERLRQLYFEKYSAFYTLRTTNDTNPADGPTKSSPEVDMYVKGRWMTIMWTLGFTFVYFVLTNPHLILELLEEEEEEGELGDENCEEDEGKTNSESDERT